MKKTVFALVLFAACAALAETAWVRRDPPHVEWFGKPSYVDVAGGGRIWSPSDETCLADGWEAFEYGGNPHDAVLDYSAPVAVRDMTQEELDARAAEQAAAQAESDRLAALPVVYTNGVEVPWLVFLDSTNRQKGVAMELTEAGDQLFYVFHASPVDWARVKSNRAAAHARLAARKEAVEGVKRKGASANSVPALREAFSNLCVELNRPWIIPGM